MTILQVAKLAEKPAAAFFNASEAKMDKKMVAVELVKIAKSLTAIKTP